METLFQYQVREVSKRTKWQKCPYIHSHLNGEENLKGKEWDTRISAYQIVLPSSRNLLGFKAAFPSICLSTQRLTSRTSLQGSNQKNPQTESSHSKTSNFLFFLHIFYFTYASKKKKKKKKQKQKMPQTLPTLSSRAGTPQPFYKNQKNFKRESSPSLSKKTLRSPHQSRASYSLLSLLTSRAPRTFSDTQNLLHTLFFSLTKLG